MCGRYAITTAPDALRRFFGYEEQPNFPARYNIAPTQPIPVVRRQDGRRRFALVRWGLLPYWVKDPRTFPLLINARCEAVSDKPAFRNAMQRRRCLVPADGYYAWKAVGRTKQPYYVRLKSGAPMAFAGLWETWTGPNGEEMETAVIITTAANAALGAIDERMPAILPPEAFDLWLDCDRVDAEMAAALLLPAGEELLDFHAVSPAVNRVANDSPDLLEPASVPAASEEPAKRAKKDDGQASLF
jgi:putative SOS response-associated peptidase YedK